MKKNLFKKNKLLMSWTLSYVAIFILQIVMSIFVYTQSMNNVMKQIKQKNEVVVARMQERVDTRIEAMEKLMLQIAQNSDVAELLKHKTAEEIAYNMRWISREALLRSAEKYGKSSYGQHLRSVAEGKILYSTEKPGESLATAASVRNSVP